ncbi:MAG: ribonuclease III [Thermotoga sp.]|nr:MAG: ribonuclease III [Thermotoga sp.]HDM71035.1 ribonuclease III [Thermotogales bacterium]
MRKDDLLKLMEEIKYRFKNVELLEKAMVHSSYANEKHLDGSNERLEFLGDSIVGLVVAEELFKRYSLPEGELSKAKATLVSEKMLSKLARRIGLGNYLKLGKGEEKSGGRDKDSILADAFEALMGAIYLDGGIENVRRIMEYLLKDEYDKVMKKEILRDFKTELQEKTQRMFKVLPEYVLIDRMGPSHASTFIVEVRIMGKVMGRAKGSSKKEAEKEAAKMALKALEKELNDGAD